MKEKQISSQIKNLLVSLNQLESDISEGKHLLFQKDKLKDIAIQLHLLADQIGIEDTKIDTPIEQATVVETKIQEVIPTPTVAKLVETVKEVVPEPEPTPEPIPEPKIESKEEIVEVPVSEIQEPETEVEVPKIEVELVPVKPEMKKEAVENIVLKPLETKKENIVETISVNDKLSKSAMPPQNIAEKLKETPIPDLVKAIAISKKFEFINLLFDGNSEFYKYCIQTIQSSTDYQLAIQFIEQEVIVKYDWQEHEKLASEFFSLVRRRFLIN
jgi:hypothetical protein